MSVINLTADNFDEEVLLSDKTVLVDFFAVWCGPCRMVSPVVDEIAEEREDVKVCKVNVDEQPGLAERFSVSSIPALMVFKDGTAGRWLFGDIPKLAFFELF